MNEVVTQEAATFVQAAPKTNDSMLEVQSDVGIAQIKAMVLVAQMNPRDEAKAVDRIINSCTRPSLARVARYTYSRGGTNITGPSIRLIEAVAQQWGHIKWGWKEIERRKDSSVCQAYAWDMQSNAYRDTDFVVPHYRDKRSGRDRLTSDRDIYELCANMAARRMRSCLENGIIPGDVIEIAENQCIATLQEHDPVTKESVKALMDAFEGYGVTRAMLEKRIGRSIEAMTPGQQLSLRYVWSGIKDGMGSVADYFDTNVEKKEEEKPKPKQGVEALKEQLTGGEEAKAPESKPTEQDEPATQPELPAMTEEEMVAHENAEASEAELDGDDIPAFLKTENQGD